MDSFAFTTKFGGKELPPLDCWSQSEKSQGCSTHLTQLGHDISFFMAKGSSIENFQTHETPSLRARSMEDVEFEHQGWIMGPKNEEGEAYHNLSKNRKGKPILLYTPYQPYQNNPT